MKFFVVIPLAIYIDKSLTNVELISPRDVGIREIQEVGEDLGSLLGRVLESKMQVEGIIARLEELS